MMLKEIVRLMLEEMGRMMVLIEEIARLTIEDYKRKSYSSWLPSKRSYVGCLLTSDFCQHVGIAP